VSQDVIYYKFDELSDGQRILIVLYTLIHYSRANENYILCLDEPENFLALPEIQYLASHAGYWFSRQDNGAVRTQRVIEEGESGLSIAELVSRGWIYDE